jgi:hypothetical protein
VLIAGETVALIIALEVPRGQTSNDCMHAHDEIIRCAVHDVKILSRKRALFCSKLNSRRYLPINCVVYPTDLWRLAHMPSDRKARNRAHFGTRGSESEVFLRRVQY